MKFNLWSGVFALIGFLMLSAGYAHVFAQSAPNIDLFTLPSSAPTHTSCPVAIGTSSLCFASDGLYQSINGGAYTAVQTPASAGVTSISVNGATPQSGAVSITVPTKATSTSTTTTTTVIQ